MSPTHSVKTMEAQETVPGALKGAWEKNIDSVRKVWIDLENSPHVPFFAPIMKELERRGSRWC